MAVDRVAAYGPNPAPDDGRKRPKRYAATGRDSLAVMADVQSTEPNWHARAEEHRQMARAAIRVALHHGIHENEILREYERIQKDEARGV